jgi:hypothetical protein
LLSETANQFQNSQEEKKAFHNSDPNSRNQGRIGFIDGIDLIKKAEVRKATGKNPSSKKPTAPIFGIFAGLPGTID